MADSKHAWDEVGERFAALGRRFDQHRSATAAEPDAPGRTAADDIAAAVHASDTDGGGTDGTPDASAQSAGERDRLTLQTAVDDLGRALDRVVNALGPTVRDPAFRDDAKSAVRSLGEALTATFAEVGENVRDALRRDSSSKGGGPSEPEPPPSS